MISSFNPLGTIRGGSTRNVPCYTDEEIEAQRRQAFSLGAITANEGRAGSKPGLGCRATQGLKDTQQPLCGE